MQSRREFFRNAALLTAAGPLLSRAAPDTPSPVPATVESADEPPGGGDQRLPVEKLRRWERLGYGMFLHFGMSTYLGRELPDGTASPARYRPDRLDAGQWIGAARDAGMRYAVLTAKHVAGFCLWPSACTDYHVGRSPVKTDVVEAFANACARHGVLPGLYYCCWDNHNRFGSMTPTDVYRLPRDEQLQGPHGWAAQAFTTRAYQDFVWRQIEELMTRYGPIAELWIDIPGVLPRGFRNDLYRQVAAWQPDTAVLMNAAGDPAGPFPVDYAWPTDLLSMERSLPRGFGIAPRWRKVEGKTCYLPWEACDTLRKNWFYVQDDPLRSDEELLGMRLVCRSRGANLLLDVPPDPSGLIPGDSVRALDRLRANLERCCVA